MMVVSAACNLDLERGKRDHQSLASSLSDSPPKFRASFDPSSQIHSVCFFSLSNQRNQTNIQISVSFLEFLFLFLYLKSESFPLLLKMCGCLIFSRENKMTGTKRHSRNQIVLDFLFHLIQLNSHVFKYLMTTMWNASLTPLSNNS